MKKRFRKFMYMLRSRIAILPLFSLVVFIFSQCAAPHSMLQSGKVVPKGVIRGGVNYTFNISSVPIEKSIQGAYNINDSYANKDTILLNTQVESINKAFLAYCLDPITFNDEIYVRIGLGKRMDMGFKTVGGAHQADMMYQFLGSNGTFDNSDYRGMYGSVGLQYSWQNYRFLKYPMFDKIEKIFNFEMSRKDITIPITFSKSFGPEERVGCFSFGFVYSHSFIKYKIEPKNIYKAADQAGLDPVLLEPVKAKMDFDSYGTFVNFKIGKKYVFFNLSLTAYYQKYGLYPLIGGSSVRLEGWSIVPSYGIQFNIPTKKKKKDVGVQS
jgi:hypothetical protein